MDTKTPSQPVECFRYAPEDLKPRYQAAEDAALDAFLEQNQDELNASIEEAEEEIARGEYFTFDQVLADLKAQRQRRRAGLA